jgi:hypothetical protein
MRQDQLVFLDVAELDIAEQRANKHIAGHAADNEGSPPHLHEYIGLCAHDSGHKLCLLFFAAQRWIALREEI